MEHQNRPGAEELFLRAVDKQRIRAFDEAEELYNQVLDVNPLHAGTYHNLAVIAMEKGNLQEAVNIAQKAISFAPGDPNFYNTLGKILQRAGASEQALLSFDRALDLEPSLAPALFNRADLLFQLARYEEAMKALDLYTLYAPNDGRALLMKSYIYAGKFDFLSARQAYEEAHAFNPGDAAAYNLRGTVHLRLGMTKEALEDYTKALDLEPGLHVTWNNKAVIYQHRGEMQKAREAYEKALDLDPFYTAALRHLAQIHKFKKDDDVSRRIKKAEEGRGRLTPARAAELDYALGKYYGDIGAMEDSFKSYSRGAAILSKILPFDMNAEKKKTELIKSVFPKGFAWPETGETQTAKPVPIFIVSMPRAGSTLVEQILASHSLVFGAGEQRKLPQLIGNMSQYIGLAQNLGAHRKALDNRAGSYLAYLQTLAQGANYVCDKLPYNYLNIGFIRLMFPQARIIHVHRAPLDNCVSCMTTYFIEGHEWSRDLKNLGGFYSLYHDLMAHWREVMPEGSFIDMRYEDLVENPEDHIRRILEYCGLPWDDACLDFHNTSRSVRTASSLQVRQPLYKSSVGRWRAYEPWLGPLREALEPVLDES